MDPTKVKGFLKYHSYIIFPLLLIVLCLIINKYSTVLELNNNKAEALISVSSSLLGVLITILTIYLAVPRSEIIIKRLRESKHEHIYLSNIAVGIILLFISIIGWIFLDNVLILTITFLSSISNIAIAVYYTFKIITS